MTTFLVDEGCDAIIVRTLRKLGHDVVFVAEVSPGKTDPEILAWGLAERRVIVTEDRDFGELVFRDRLVTSGVVLVRIGDEDREKKVTQIEILVNNHLADLPNAMTTVMVEHIRIRPLPEQL